MNGSTRPMPGASSVDADILPRLHALADALNAHDLDRIMAMFAEDAALEMPRGPRDPHGFAVHHSRLSTRSCA